MTKTLVCKEDTKDTIAKINNGMPPCTVSTTRTKARALAQTLRTASIRLAAAGEVLAAGALMEIVNNMEGRKS